MRDDFHVIGADVVPVPFSIFGSVLLDGDGAECPSPQAANYSSKLYQRLLCRVELLLRQNNLPTAYGLPRDRPERGATQLKDQPMDGALFSLASVHGRSTDACMQIQGDLIFLTEDLTVSRGPQETPTVTPECSDSEAALSVGMSAMQSSLFHAYIHAGGRGVAKSSL